MTIDLEAIRKRWVDTGYGPDHPDYGLSAAERMDRRASYAIQDVPDLIAEVERLRARLEVAHGGIERLRVQLEECDAERQELRGRALVNATSDLFDMCEPGTPEEIDEILREAGHDPDDVGRKMAQTAREALKRLVPDIEDSKR